MSISSKATGLRPGVCTSTTRPSSPYTGFIIYETDTGYLRVWDGANWDYMSKSQDYAQGLGAGKVLQVVFGSTTTEVTNSTATYADTTLAATITPSSSSSKILVIANQNGCYKTTGNSENRLQLRVVRDSTELVNSGTLHLYTGTALIQIGGYGISVLDSPATSSSTTYKTQFRNPNGTASVLVQAGTAASTITLMEVAG